MSQVLHSQKAVGLAQPPTSSSPFFLDGEEKERHCATCLACDKLLSLLSWLKTSFSCYVSGRWLWLLEICLHSVHFTSFTLGSVMLCSIRFWWDNFDWPQLHAEEHDLIVVKQGRGLRSLPTIGSTWVSLFFVKPELPTTNSLLGKCTPALLKCTCIWQTNFHYCDQNGSCLLLWNLEVPGPSNQDRYTLPHDCDDKRHLGQVKTWKYLKHHQRMQFVKSVKSGTCTDSSDFTSSHWTNFWRIGSVKARLWDFLITRSQWWLMLPWFCSVKRFILGERLSKKCKCRVFPHGSPFVCFLRIYAFHSIRNSETCVCRVELRRSARTGGVTLEGTVESAWSICAQDGPEKRLPAQKWKP